MGSGKDHLRTNQKDPSGCSGCKDPRVRKGTDGVT